MLDWKILAASIVALLFISSIFLGGFGIRDFLSSIVQKLSGFLGTSPFGNVFPSSTQPSGKSEREISVLLSPDSMTLQPSTEASLLAGETQYTKLQGDIVISFSNSTVELRSSSLSASFPLKTLNITSLTLKSLSLKGAKLEIEPDISTDAGDVEITDFIGSAVATKKGLELTGNVSQLTVTIGKNTFNLV